MNLIHPDYSLLAARIAVNNLHKETKVSFAETVRDLYEYKVVNNLNIFSKG
jgi:ribonucleoside-diphosphate reductase alpha chain